MDGLKKMTPYSNTGSMNTQVKPLRALVDWLSVTFFTFQSWESIADLLCIDSREFVVENKGKKGYENHVTFGHIEILFNETKNIHMGIHLNMSGQGCREYEKLFDYDLNWSLFFSTLLEYKHNITRLDIAIDDFKGYFTVQQAVANAKRGCMTALRVKKARQFEEFILENGETDGLTFYVGKSDWMIRFYDKLAEQKGKNKDVQVDFWNRYEIQLRTKVANEAVKYLAYNHMELGRFVKGFLKAKIDFKIKSKTDTNRSRWKSQKWWLDFLEDVEPIGLTQSAPDMSIVKKMNWVDEQVTKTLYMLMESFGEDDEKLFDYLYKVGKSKIDEKDRKMIKEFKNSIESEYIKEGINLYLDEAIKKDYSASDSFK